ncbi:unnamed protein product [Rotaria sp. Silwood2]|nr:unnamed protein product [Rotaria sp. Silwood2]
MSPTFSATDALICDYESKALFWFRWATSLIEYVIYIFITCQFYNSLCMESYNYFNMTLFLLLEVTGGCLDHALAIEFSREAQHSRIYTYRCDLSDLNALKYTITAICEEVTDNISVLVNCAATAHLNNILSHTDDEYQYTLIVNTLAPILITEDLLHEMITRNHGQIVNILSNEALTEDAFSSSYPSSKEALFSEFLLS